MYRKSIFVALILFLASCNTISVPVSVGYKGYRVENQQKQDTSLLNLIKPYSIEVNKTMTRVIGFANASMYKKQPESSLGNLMADCILQMCLKKYQTAVDVGFMNDGGIRAGINKGNITVGNVYELMPFDNLLVLQKLKGSMLEQLIQLMAADGGWPISAGSSYKIKDKKAVDIIINNKPLDVNATYTVANSDYVANGGSNAFMLKAIPQQNKGYLFRDALIEYISSLTQMGKPVEAKIENRITLKNE
jgi:2',3'-cyclic-nucleotide 2'-phosphodiesterase (5'-nucleotidase family)